MRDITLECTKCGEVFEGTVQGETDGQGHGSCLACSVGSLEEIAREAVVAEIGQERADAHEAAGEWLVKTYFLGPNPRV